MALTPPTGITGILAVVFPFLLVRTDTTVVTADTTDAGLLMATGFLIATEFLIATGLLMVTETGLLAVMCAMILTAGVTEGDDTTGTALTLGLGGVDFEGGLILVAVGACDLVGLIAAMLGIGRGTGSWGRVIVGPGTILGGRADGCCGLVL